MIRPATLADVPAIVDLAVESVSRNPIPVRIDRGAMRDTAKVCISSAQHFLWVAEADGEVVGAVAAASQQSFWYERQQCSVLLYYARVPGEGLKLLRQFARWVKGRPAIKVAIIELEPETDPRLIHFLNRVGFSRGAMNFSYVRGMTDV